MVDLFFVAGLLRDEGVERELKPHRCKVHDEVCAGHCLGCTCLFCTNQRCARARYQTICMFQRVFSQVTTKNFHVRVMDGWENSSLGSTELQNCGARRSWHEQVKEAHRRACLCDRRCCVHDVSVGHQRCLEGVSTHTSGHDGRECVHQRQNGSGGVVGSGEGGSC